jgi:fructokinase
MAQLLGGVETGGTWCVCALGTGSGEIVERKQFPTTSPPETLERIVAFFESHARPAAVGIGSFGPLDVHPESPRWGYVTTTPKPGWQHTSVAAVIAQRLGVPVGFDLDVTASAIGEQLWGAGRGVPTLCYVTVGTGIGAGLLVDGRPLPGLIHPEVGHLRVPHDRGRDPFAGACPAHGDCWEGLASGRALAERWQKRPQDLGDDHEAWALEAEYLALGLLGGGVMERPGLDAMVKRRLRELLAGYLDSPLLTAEIDQYLMPPALGDDAGVLGAIALGQRALG